MSPLSQIKKLALGDDDEVKRLANQAYLKQLTEKQIKNHEMSKRTLRKQGSRDRSSHDIVDPIGYFENRYFPVAGEDLHLYEKSKRSLSKINEEKGQQIDEASLRTIKEFERIADQENEREEEANIEQDFDTRTQQQMN